ncbi:uncharacterized protein TRIADDRAFT_62037 [Trichoplax adhaerens]|uniref:Uncharacterized protein n=1 Tax=Trichoplax adhaerens TaxID=10228 RepID=B3SCN3_TRIAD|nr:predicted protein [Trichoplax adhaerens]EDV19482.1 predicted protein [Trichoplax adhaerens]|eukprot:XP_002117999.1 predicted protein [Trichoplax adhaerens]
MLSVYWILDSLVDPLGYGTHCGLVRLQTRTAFGPHWIGSGSDPPRTVGHHLIFCLLGWKRRRQLFTLLKEKPFNVLKQDVLVVEDSAQLAAHLDGNRGQDSAFFPISRKPFNVLKQDVLVVEDNAQLAAHLDGNRGQDSAFFPISRKPFNVLKQDVLVVEDNAQLAAHLDGNRGQDSALFPIDGSIEMTSSRICCIFLTIPNRRCLLFQKFPHRLNV